VQQIGRLLGRAVPDKPMPAIILKSIGRISFWVSCLTRREPDITPEKAYLVSTKLICSSDKAQKELGYRVISLETMLEDCHRWLLTSGLL
jgi:nucleoside-diphosphate-sugar epimerase